jgi:hypothetical protein
MSACPAYDDREGDRSAVLRIDRLRGHVRSALVMARVLLQEVLDERFSHDDPEGYRRLASKAGSEMAMMLRLARRVLPDAGDIAEIDSLARALAPVVRSPQLYRSVVMRPSRTPAYAVGHLCLADLGVIDERLDRVVRLALCSSVCAANERVPYRMLDAAWSRHLAFGDGELDHPAVPLSPLGAGVDLLEASSDDAYAYSHALLYATDFGRLPLTENLDRLYLLGIAEALVVKALDEDDLDLLAELLMAPAILRVGWTPTLQFGWEVLDRVWSELGFVPGPGLPAPVGQETRAQAVRRVLGTTYHTTFAAGLCCATLIDCDAAPGEHASGPPGGNAPPPGQGAAWKANWNLCPRAIQDNLRFLQLGFALRRAVENVDLPRIHGVLTLAAGCHLVDHPLFLQALELLERMGAG